MNSKTKQAGSALATAQAEETAVAVLGWMAGQPELMGRFLALSGLTADGLRAASIQPGFHAGLLSFLMNHEPTLLAFCADTNTDPARVAGAYHALATHGGDAEFGA